MILIKINSILIFINIFFFCINIEQDCTSEREFACPPKRRRHEFIDIIDEDNLISLRKAKNDFETKIRIDGTLEVATEYFGKRHDLAR